MGLLRWWRRAGDGAAGAGGDPQAGAADADRPERSRWSFDDGAAISDGRHLLKRLGGGSHYEVYLAWDERLFALVVVKVLRPDAARDPRALRDLGREADLVARLAHPSLVRGFGAVRDGPHPHLVLEHLEGPTLHRLIGRDGPLPLEQLLPLALQVVAVLQYLSAEGVVHLDVKPGNIVMGVPPRLLDLSIARPVESAARLRQPVGTDAYMAPEQCAPSPAATAVGPPADIWGLGATLYHAATGEVPFPRSQQARRSADPLERFPQLARAAGPLASGPGMPAEFAELLGRMLAPRPEDRPTARDVADALEPLVAAAPSRWVHPGHGVRGAGRVMHVRAW